MLVDFVEGAKCCTMFDFVTKGILQEAVKNTQYDRLKDGNGKAPGMVRSPAACLSWLLVYTVPVCARTNAVQACPALPCPALLRLSACISAWPGKP